MAVYTCTMNLAIDLFIQTKRMDAGIVNRTETDDILANGKGVNVSLIMKQLSQDSTALGFSAGFTGQYIADTLKSAGIKPDFITVDGLTRINVFTHVEETGEEFKLVNQGPEVSEPAQEKLLKQISSLNAGDYLVVSGSLPKGISPEIFLTISTICQEKKVKLVLDISDPILLDCLAYSPSLIKPNDEELATWFRKETVGEEELLLFAKELVSRGAKNVLLSLGDKGAVFVGEQQEIYRCNAPKGDVVNTACAGDTLLGTFLAKRLAGESVELALPYAVAAGSSTAFRSGLTDFSDVDKLVKQITIQKVEVMSHG